MGDRTGIEWTTATWNPVTGCSKVSPGCARCYAEAISLRFGRGVGPWTPENAAENVVLHHERLDQPLRWKRPRIIFVNSMSDLFHEQIPLWYIERIWDVMAACPQHTFQILTKRPERMRVVVPGIYRRYPTAEPEPDDPSYGFGDITAAKLKSPEMPSPLPNVWLGVSIENRRFVHRADLLRQVPAAVRFISAEPLLGPLLPDDGDGGWEDDYEGPGLYVNEIDWVIAGGESGSGARPMRLEWMRALWAVTRTWADDETTQLPGRHCAFFCKQDSGARPGRQGRIPDDIWQVKELPTTNQEGLST